MTDIFWGFQTHFSMGESIIDPEEGIKAIAEAGYRHVALADTMSVSAVISASKAAKKHGVELITGCTLRVKDGDHPYYYPKVYMHTEAAFKRLFALLSGVKRERDWSYVTQEAFLEFLDSDVTVTSGSAQGLFSSAVDVARRDAYIDAITSRAGTQGFNVELTSVAAPAYARANAEAISYAVDHNVGTVLNPVALYLTAKEHDARDVMQGLLARRKIGYGTMRWFPDRGRFIKEFREVSKDFQDSLDLADRINPAWSAGANSMALAIRNEVGLDYRWTKKDPALPALAVDEFAELQAQCKDRFKDRIMRPVFGYQPDSTLIPVYVERLKYELSILEKMGFSGYFLLVADLVQWSKDNGIIVGPGRGSVGGSLVAFIMGITEVDPIRFDLLFERFINPGRKDLPDADLDFMSERRHEVIEYLKDRYGADHVGGIANYNTLQGAGALREVGKCLGIPEKEYECSKMVPKEHGQPIELTKAITMVADIESYALKNPVAFEISTHLEGVLRTMGQHAAGIVVCNEPLQNRAVVDDRKEDLTINWDKRVSEDQGLVKIDILGLSNLDVIEKAFRKIEHDTGKVIDILDIPLDDRKVLDAFGRGETVGVFQFESSGMRKLLKDLAKAEPLSFEELSAAMSLFRPGPLDSGMLDDYVNIRQGIMEPYYDHPNMEPALKVTGGIMIYQEQIMQVARDLAGFTLQEADDLRKAMGKKDKAAMAEQRDKWVEGCMAHSSLRDSTAGALFDKVEAFAGYGFNRSHSIEYSIISFVSMWLKVYYPLQFYAASLEVLKEEKLKGLVEDAAKHGISILPPDINLSDGTFKRDGSGKNLTCPFNRLKGISENALTAILEARKAGPFKSQADFVNRVEKRRCNKRVVEVLERVGAFANLEKSTPPANSPTRTRDQLELMPGLVSTRVQVDRHVEWDEHTKRQIAELVIVPANKIALSPVNPRASRQVQVVVITDAATKQEEKAGSMMNGSNADYIKRSIEEAGLKWNKGFYYTALCKVPKKEKRLTAEEFRQWGPILKTELDILQPAIIVCLGSEISRYMIPDLKGGIVELAGTVVYDKGLDANIVLGITPGMIWVDPSKSDLMDKTFETVAELMS